MEAGPAAASAPDPERETLLTLVTALGPALLGWIVCAQFASVALNWTFYFVLGILVATRAAAVQHSTNRVPLTHEGLLNEHRGIRLDSGCAGAQAARDLGGDRAPITGPTCCPPLSTTCSLRIIRRRRRSS